MRPLLAALLSTLVVTVSVEAADRYLVATRNVPREMPLRMLRDSGDSVAHSVRTFRSLNAFAATLTDGEAAVLRQSPEVLSVTKVVPRQISGTATARFLPQSTFTQTQRMPYGIAMIHAPEVWKVTRGAGPINVVVLDTGITPNHPDIASNYAGGYNVFTGTNDPTDDHGHGTHVSGIIAAADNDIGVVGVAPEVRIWAVKVLDHLGVGTDENIAAGTDWVIAKKHEVGGDWIMSLSLGGEVGSPVEEAAFKRVIDDGILVTAAAGNQATPNVEYPSAYPGVIAVGALDSAMHLAWFSNSGPRLNIVAPGVGVISTAVPGTAAGSVMTLSNGSTFVAAALLGSNPGAISGHYVDCGLGRPQDFPAEVNGNIALIKRGDMTFNMKVRNAQAAGARAVIVYNYDDYSQFGSWSLLAPYCGNGCDDATHDWPVALAISAANGQSLLADPSHYIDMLDPWLDNYVAFNGTSQATPHVAGALALLWSLDPGARAADVKDALLSTATDLGAPGWDSTFGSGLVNVYAAGKKLAPWRFLPNQNTPPPDTRPPLH
jgi:serine protease